MIDEVVASTTDSASIAVKPTECPESESHERRDSARRQTVGPPRSEWRDSAARKWRPPDPRRVHAALRRDAGLKKAELVEGVVYVPSPVRHKYHGRQHLRILNWIGHYEAGTPGLKGSDNSTNLLSRPRQCPPARRPPLHPARIWRPGQAQRRGLYRGPARTWLPRSPASSASYDLHDKLNSYRRNGVREYVVHLVLGTASGLVRAQRGRFEPLVTVPDGLFSSTIFPGLWLYRHPLVRGDLATVLAVVQQGLNSPNTRPSRPGCRQLLPRSSLCKPCSAGRDQANVQKASPMSVVTQLAAKPSVLPARNGEIPPLESGDRLNLLSSRGATTRTPVLKKAELIEGVVYVPSPVRQKYHGAPHSHLVGWLVTYRAGTPGVETGDNSTILLDLDNAPQPDASSRSSSLHGGRVKINEDGGSIQGGPDLVAEVAASSASYDLHDKLNSYRRNGVREYIVHRVLDQQVDWFVLRVGRFEALEISPDGPFRSTVFLGLLARPGRTGARRPRDGAGGRPARPSSPEHATFAAGLQATGKGVT